MSLIRSYLHRNSRTVHHLVDSYSYVRLVAHVPGDKKWFLVFIVTGDIISILIVLYNVNDPVIHHDSTV